ncbi:MAG: hypothetical protein ACRCV0_00825 [Brevinema sp.]
MSELQFLLDLFKISKKSQTTPTPSNKITTKEEIKPEQTDKPNLEEFKKMLTFFFSNEDFKEECINILKKLAHQSPDKKDENTERVSHRFDGKNYRSGKGISNLAKGIHLEETEVFADEVEKLCKEGLDRRSAYLKARQNLINSEN